MVPAVYLLAVAVIGRGEDIVHPAPWAWIAADGGDRSAWILPVVLLVVGITVYVAMRPRAIALPAEA